jgi:hypothetical protein
VDTGYSSALIALVAEQKFRIQRKCKEDSMDLCVNKYTCKSNCCGLTILWFLLIFEFVYFYTIKPVITHLRNCITQIRPRNQIRDQNQMLQSCTLFSDCDLVTFSDWFVDVKDKIILWKYTRCGNKETGLILLLISGHFDDEEEGRALTCGLPSTVTQRFIHARRLVWPWPVLEADRVSELRRNNAEWKSRTTC